MMISTLAHRALERDGLGPIRDKVLAGERLTDADALRLLETADLAAVGALANHVREARHGDLTFYNRNVHLNPTNVCVATCKFCSFAPQGRPGRVRGLHDEPRRGGREGARAPLARDHRGAHRLRASTRTCPGSTTRSSSRRIRKAWPELAIKAFTAIEIHFFAEKFGKSYEQVLRELHAAGMDTMPGGGAEIFASRGPQEDLRRQGDRRAVARDPPHRAPARHQDERHHALRAHRAARRARRSHAAPARAAGRDRRVPGVHPARVPPRAQHDRQGVPEADRLRRAPHARRGAPLPRQLRPREGVLGVARRAARRRRRSRSAWTTWTAPCSRSASTTWPARRCPQALSERTLHRPHPRGGPGSGRARQPVPRPQDPRRRAGERARGRSDRGGQAAGPPGPPLAPVQPHPAGPPLAAPSRRV